MIWFLAIICVAGLFYLNWMLISCLYMDMHWNNYDSIIDLPTCENVGVFCFNGTRPIIYILTFLVAGGLEQFIFKLIRNRLKGESCQDMLGCYCCCRQPTAAAPSPRQGAHNTPGWKKTVVSMLGRCTSCNNKAAVNCTNNACGRCCQEHGGKFCPRHSASNRVNMSSIV